MKTSRATANATPRQARKAPSQAKAAPSQAPATPRPASPHLQVAYRLDALLHTMRALARSEEQLCSLMHSIQTERTLPARARAELVQLLEDLPTDICDADRHAALDSLEAPAPPRRSPSREPTSAPKTPARKRPEGKAKPASQRAAAPARKQAAPPVSRRTRATKAAKPGPAGRRSPAKTSRSRTTR